MSAQDIIEEIESKVEKPMITARFHDDWKEHAKDFSKETLINIAWRQGRKAILLEEALRDQVRKKRIQTKPHHILLRILGAPFVYSIIFVSYNYHAIRNAIMVIRYGGEWISYSNKDEKKTIYDIYEKIKQDL